MHTRSLARRSVAVVATTALITGGLATGMLASPAYAIPGTPTVTSFTPNQWDNRSLVTIGVTGTGFFNIDQTGATNDAVYLTPVAADGEVAEFFATAQPSESTTSLTAKFNLAKTPPGDYHLSVQDSQQHRSVSAPGVFTIYAYGGANATGSIFGTNTASASSCTTNCVSRGPLPIDITGSNIAVGAKVRFLLPSSGPSNGPVDEGMGFVQGNPNHTTNGLGEGAGGTASADGVAGSGYVSTTLLQGNYTLKPDKVVLGQPAPDFTVGWHKLQIVNTDGNTTGATSDFVQPWFVPATTSPASSPLSPTGIGIGATNSVLTLTGQGIRAGSKLTVEPHATNSCADITVGPSTVSGGPDANGLFTKVSAPVSMADCTTDNMSDRAVGVLGPDGGSFSRAGLLHVVPNPAFPQDPSDPVLTPGYETLGQGAHVGFGAEEVDIFGTGFQGDPAFPGVPGGHPDKMTKFSFGDGITVQTVLVGSGFAQVRIDVANDAATGDRTATATNPDGGSVSRSAGSLPPPLDFAAPLTIAAGPQVTKVDPSGLPPSTTSGAQTITVTGTFTSADSFTAVICDHLTAPPFDCTESPNISEGVVTDSATTLTFPVSTNGAAPGLKDLVITDTTNKGRYYCAGCMGIDSLLLGAPTSVPNTGDATLNFTLDASVGSGTATTASTATLTRVVTLPGQLPISLKTGTTLTPGAAGTHTASGTFDLTGVAPGKYSVAVVQDPTSQSSPTWTCNGCLTVTGAAITTATIDRVPSDGTVDATTGAGQGATGVVVKVTGTNFTKGMQVSIPDKVTVHDLTLVNAAELTFKVDVAGDAPTGDKVVTVSAGDGAGPGTGSKTTNLVFTVTPAPTPSGAPAPAAYGQGAGSPGFHAANSGQTITIAVSGTDFQNDATLSLGPDVTVTSPSVVQGADPVGVCPACIPGTDDVLTATVSVAETAAVGKRDVVVMNGDGGSGRVVQGFTVNDGPKVASVANATQAPVLIPDGVSHPITVFGSGFAAADPKSTLAIVPIDGVTIANVVVASSGKITADVTVATDAARGARTLGVTNPSDKGFGSLTPVYVARVPDVPRSLTLTGGASSITATWLAPLSNGGAPVTGYHLTIRRGGTTTVIPYDVSGTTLTKTFSSLANGVTYAISVQAVNAAGAGTPANKVGIPGIVTTLTAVASTKLTTAATTMTFSGKLLHSGLPVANQYVNLLFAPSVGAAFTRKALTSSTGAWSYRFTPMYTFYMKASFPVGNTYRASSAPTILVQVRARVLRTAPANGSTSSASTVLKIAGNVYPNKHGQYVYLYRYVNGSKFFVARTVLTSSSTFVFSGTPGKGTYVYRVYIANTKGNLANYSDAFTIKRV
jgi:uncharacterized protein (DUF2141 family)